MKPLKKNKLTISIQKPLSEVFSFVLDPRNTPKWIDFITIEETNEWPVQEGTVYRNLNKEGVWNEYDITSIEANNAFILRAKDGNYHVRYTLTPISDTETELEYYEWVIRGVLEQPFFQTTLEKLKDVLENK